MLSRVKTDVLKIYSFKEANCAKQRNASRPMNRIQKANKQKYSGVIKQ